MTDTASPSELLLDLDSLLTAEQRGWQRRAREFAVNRVLPTIEQDFEDRVFRRELISELGTLGMLRVLNGAKRWIGLGSVADVAVIWARTEDGVRGFLVPTDTPGFRAVDIENKLSLRASIQCDVFLEDVRVPSTSMLPAATGLSAPLRCLGDARYGIVWGVMGAARVCLDTAVERSKFRRVFGRMLGEMQLTQKKLAYAFVEYEKGMLVALHLGRCTQMGVLAPEQISVGKLNNVREAIAIASMSRGVLGEGVTTDFSVMRHMANLESVRTYEGTDEIHTLVLGRALTGMPAFR